MQPPFEFESITVPVDDSDNSVAGPASERGAIESVGGFLTPYYLFDLWNVVMERNLGLILVTRDALSSSGFFVTYKSSLLRLFSKILRRNAPGHSGIVDFLNCSAFQIYKNWMNHLKPSDRALFPLAICIHLVQVTKLTR